MDIQSEYKKVTGVDIRDQMVIWNERGKGYYGEYLVFSEIFKKLIGQYKILMNVNLPVENNKTTEADIIILHEKCVFVLEVKHYKSIIYGDSNDESWTQFFKGQANEHFHNPIMQNEYHIRALSKLIPDQKIFSVIVFTNQDVELNITNHEKDTYVLRLSKLANTLNELLRQLPESNDADKLESDFEKLRIYSPIVNNNDPARDNGITVADKESWINVIIQDFQNEKNKILTEKKTVNEEREKYTLEEKKAKTAKKVRIIAIIILVALTVFFNYVVSCYYKDKYQKEYEQYAAAVDNIANQKITEMASKFEHVDTENNQYTKAVNNFIKVSDLSLVEVTDKITKLSYKLSLLTNEYSVLIPKDVNYIVITVSGKSYEYSFKTTSFFGWQMNIKEGPILFERLLEGVNPNEIAYIKLVGVDLNRNSVYQTVQTGLELEIYKK